MPGTPHPNAMCRCGHFATMHSFDDAPEGPCLLFVGAPGETRRCPCLAFAEPLPDPYFASYVAEQEARRKQRGGPHRSGLD